jgi:hypothetical protein
LKDGRQIQTECLSARGGPDRPFEPDVLHHKINSLVSVSFPSLARNLLALCDLPPALLAQPWSQLLAQDQRAAK